MISPGDTVAAEPPGIITFAKRVALPEDREGEVLSLERVTGEMLPLLLAWRSDTEITRWMTTIRRSQEQTPQTWMSQVDSVLFQRGDHLMVWTNPDRRPIGKVSVNDENEVSLMIGEKSLWGKGYGTRALRLFMDLIGDGDWWAVIRPENIGSQRAFGRCGFHNTGEKHRTGHEIWRLSPSSS